MKKIICVSLMLFMMGCAICPVPKPLKNGLIRQRDLLSDLKSLSLRQPSPKEMDLHQNTMQRGLDAAIEFNESLQKYLDIGENKNDKLR